MYSQVKHLDTWHLLVHESLMLHGNNSMLNHLVAILCWSYIKHCLYLFLRLLQSFSVHSGRPTYV